MLEKKTKKELIDIITRKDSVEKTLRDELKVLTDKVNKLQKDVDLAEDFAQAKDLQVCKYKTAYENS